jgi:hypothetical protein
MSTDVVIEKWGQVTFDDKAELHKKEKKCTILPVLQHNSYL